MRAEAGQASAFMASVALLLLSQTASAQRKAVVRSATTAHRGAKPVAKRDPIAALAQSLALNSIQNPNDNLATACALSHLPGLLYALQDVVADWNYTKGEFETAADYAARIGKMEAVINNGRHTIVCRALSTETTFIKYDADKSAFSVDSYALQNISSTSKDTGSYVSSTRMGVKARVYSGFTIRYGVDFGSGYDIGKKFGCAAPSFSGPSFPVPNATAQKMRSGGFLVMVGSLRQPFVSKSQRSGSPTLDDPFDTYTVEMTLKFEPEKIYLISPSGDRFPCAS